MRRPISVRSHSDDEERRSFSFGALAGASCARARPYCQPIVNLASARCHPNTSPPDHPLVTVKQTRFPQFNENQARRDVTRPDSGSRARAVSRDTGRIHRPQQVEWRLVIIIWRHSSRSPRYYTQEVNRSGGPQLLRTRLDILIRKIQHCQPTRIKSHSLSDILAYHLPIFHT